MDFGPLTFLLGYVAGLLSTLSPCVLPLLPILLATATSQHRCGPLALTAGLTLSFALVGLFIATLGDAVGLDADVLRQVAAGLLVLFGVVLVSARAQRAFQALAARFGGVGDGLLARMRGRGLSGQFALGLVLGLVWTPCVGPTLGAASTLAAQGRELPQVALMMLLFGLGAGTPLIVIGGLSRDALMRVRGRLLAAGTRGQWWLGLLFIAIGVAIFTGGDRLIEAWAVEHSPDWLTRLTTRY